MPTPVVLSFEEFAPPFKEARTFGEAFMQARASMIRPIGQGEPFLERYKLHDGRYSLYPDVNNRAIHQRGPAVVATLDGEVVGVINGVFTWIHASQRRSGGCDVDLAAELMAARRIRIGLLNSREHHYARAGKQLGMTLSAVKANRRAYDLLVERGYITPPT